jgi:predicted ATPase/class 3 adenylate cyclase
MKCPKCHFENPAGIQFCGKCGSKLERLCCNCNFANPSGFEFCGKCGNRLKETLETSPGDYTQPRSYTPKHLADKILQSKSALEGERKQVTVLFADVKGSMELAEQVDPEEWHRILDRFFQILADGVHRFEGTVNQYTGDGIMALFGAPIAHEDHAQRACYAALWLCEQLEKYAEELRLEQGLNFSARLGLNSGDVVVGKIGDDLRMDYTAQGHTVGLAQRVEQLAGPGLAYLSQHTARLVEGHFQLRDLGESKIAGATEPLRVYELQGVGPLRTRLEASARRGLLRFVGRHREMEQLQRAWEAARAGRGQIVAVLGEAGVGKSRLFYEFKGHLESGCRVLEAFSVSHGKAYAYLPLLELMKGYFRIRIEDDERRRQEKVTGTVLTLDRTLEDTLPYLFALLGIGDRTGSLEQMDPQIRRQRTLEAVKRVLVRETLDQPCVLVFEDLHWIDSETQAFLDVLVDSVATARLLLLVNYRPEYGHAWGSRTYYTRLRLDPFGEEEAQELLRALLGEEAGEERDALDRLILSKTQGNPFFLEELVQTLVEEGVLAGEPGHYLLKRSPGEFHIPATVQGVIGARIDRLASREKELLQTLAVIGKEFSLGLIRAVAGEGEEEISGGLTHLQAAEFIYERPAFPDPEYTFKHALTQEVAYGSLLRERRGVLHERTGQAIEALNPQALAAHYEDLAHHYSRSANTPKAVEYLRLAGEQAVARSAYGEAIGRLRQALGLLKTLPETRERDELEMFLQSILGQALLVTEGFTSVEAEQAYVSARDLARRLGDASQLFAALNGLRGVKMVRAEHDKARLFAEELLRVARRTGDPGQLLRALHAKGGTSFNQGEFCEAREHLEELLGLYDPKKHRGHEYLSSSMNVGVGGLYYFSSTLLILGYPDQGLTRARQGLALARDLSHPFSEATALCALGIVQRNRRESKASLETAEALIAISSEQGFAYYLATGAVLRGGALAEEGDLQEGIAGMRSVIEGLRARGAVVGFSSFLTHLASAHRKAGQVQEGLAVVAEGLEFVTKTGERFAEAELHRVKAELVLDRTPADPSRAEASFRDALEVARGQSAKSYELRAATSLARLWQQMGRKQEARNLLAPVYDWFTEGFDTQDLQEAKALLDELV